MLVLVNPSNILLTVNSIILNTTLWLICYTKRGLSCNSFWGWLLTLPIPKVIFKIPCRPICIYYLQSIYVLLLGWTLGHERGYAGMLGLSWRWNIGIWDKICIHSDYSICLFIGFSLDIFKIEEGTLVYCTALFHFFVSFRPGVQYALQYLNIFTGMLIIIASFRLFMKKRVVLTPEKGYD